MAHILAPARLAQRLGPPPPGEREGSLEAEVCAEGTNSQSLKDEPLLPAEN